MGWCSCASPGSDRTSSRRRKPKRSRESSFDFAFYNWNRSFQSRPTYTQRFIRHSRACGSNFSVVWAAYCRNSSRRAIAEIEFPYFNRNRVSFYKFSNVCSQCARKYSISRRGVAVVMHSSRFSRERKITAGQLSRRRHVFLPTRSKTRRQEITRKTDDFIPSLGRRR